MITCSLLGGTGNNLFQIAATIGTAEKHGCDYAIPTWTNAPMFAGEFNFSNEPLMLEKWVEGPIFHFVPITKMNIKLVGYFQSKKYWEHCEGKIMSMFAPAPKILEKIKWKYGHLLKRQNTCSIHVRRGDYLTLSEYHYNLETGYYTTIMKMFPDFHYVCFSDDIEWCRANIPAQEFISDSLAVDFHLMSLMKHNIIANSSFSYWASTLNANPEKMVFAPPKNKWFSTKKSHLCVNDLYCEKWIYSK